MADRHVANAPKRVRAATDETDIERWWFYEEPEGLLIVHEPEVTTQQALIPWRAIKAYAERKTGRPVRMKRNG